ncbi:MAG: septum site-determining protein MinC [Lachnospiraceae bacterium]|nr:septum site-determining protein MinC [Lachnospiraceae bacterium]
MKNAVILKSFQNGISIYLDETTPFENLIQEIALKFKESSKFFGEAKMALSIEGRVVNKEEEMQILRAIHQNSSVEIVCLVGKDEEKNKELFCALEAWKSGKAEEYGGQFYRGTLKNHQILETESSIVVVGDVCQGAAVISTKDIIILGALYGEAYAGGNGEKEHFVVALEMAPEKLKIGDFKYKTKYHKSRWALKPKAQPKIAYVKNNDVVMESITKDLLDDLY